MKKLKHLQVGDLNFNLLLELREPTFMRTKIDVVYSDINNWDYEDLLYYSSGVEKGSQRKLSYIEYIWIKIIEELKKYNFKDEEIKCYREQLFQIYPIDELELIILNQLRSQEYDEEFINKIKLEIFSTLSSVKITMLEIAIFESIVNQFETKILFFKEAKSAFPINQNSIEELEKKGLNNELKSYLRETHLNLSLQPILEKFVEGNSIDENKNMILTDDEYRLIKEVRKRLKEIKSIEIIYKREGKVDRIDVKTVKAVKAESQLMALIKSAKYAKIEMQTQQNTIVCVNHIEKIKF